MVPVQPAGETPLFRREAMHEQQAQWLGTVLIEPRVTSRLFAMTAMLSIGAVLSLLYLGSYTRKERINGWLVPEQGLARVYVAQQGVIKRILVADGAHVATGAPLLVLSAELHSGAMGATQAEVVRRLTTRRDSVMAEAALQGTLYDQQADSLRLRLAALTAEQTHLAAEIELQRERFVLADRAVERNRNLRSRRLTTAPRLEQAEQERMGLAAGVETLKRNHSALRRQQEELQAALRDLPYQRQAKLAEIARSASALGQELAESEARREFVVTAPQGGTVTDIQVETGVVARPDLPLLSIMPGGSQLRAQLFSPSRAIGFIRPGQQVLLRYRAFPFQKFGLYRGTVATVSATAISPNELPRQLAGLSSLYGLSEPVYQIAVDLVSQTAQAYGKPVPLQPGMQLEADVQIERRRLYEWLLDPLFSLTRGVQQ